jgi:hypothetical protein
MTLYYKGLLERLRNDVRRKDLKNGQTVPSSITTLRATHRFWYGYFCQKYYGVLTHLIHRIWHGATSGSSTIKMTMRDKSFDWIREIGAATTAQLKTLTKDFQNCFRKWQERCEAYSKRVIAF